MTQLYTLIVGHQSSGKTHLAKKLEQDFGFSIINGDDFRSFVYGHVRYFENEKLGKRSDRNDQLNRFLLTYRTEMTNILLSSGQNMIMDGSGFTREIREKYFEQISSQFPGVKRVIIQTEISEPELLERLSQRDHGQSEAIWQDVYHGLRKDLFEKPSENEADCLLLYDQYNYEEVRSKIQKVLGS